MRAMKIHAMNKATLISKLRETGEVLPGNVEDMNRDDLIHLAQRMVVDPSRMKEPPTDPLEELRAFGLNSKVEVESYLTAMNRERDAHKKRLIDLKDYEEDLAQKAFKLEQREKDIEVHGVKIQEKLTKYKQLVEQYQSLSQS